MAELLGAGKSGTTSLWSYLDQHPSVYMSPVKEPMYFSSDDYVANPGDPEYFMHARATRSLEDYLALFAHRTTERVAGEASTAHLPDPGAPARIHAALPDAKLVAILRHPAERAHSDYAYSRSWGIETLPTFEEAVAAELAAGRDTPSSRRFIQYGFYGAQLDRYLAHFPASQLRIYLFDDLIDDPHTVMPGIVSVEQRSARIPRLGAATADRPLCQRHAARRAEPGRRSICVAEMTASTEVLRQRHPVIANPPRSA